MKKPIKLFTKKYTNGTAHYWFTVNANNNQVLCTSETYTRKGSAVKAILAVLKALHGVYKETLPETTIDLNVRDVVVKTKKK